METFIFNPAVMAGLVIFLVSFFGGCCFTELVRDFKRDSKIYLKMRKVIKAHPNINIVFDPTKEKFFEVNGNGDVIKEIAN